MATNGLVRVLAAVFTVVFSTACSHIPMDDARWIISNAKNIAEVEDLLGRPEKQEFSRDLAGLGVEKAIYVDIGGHVSMAFIFSFILTPAVIVVMPIEWMCGGFHQRTLVVEYAIDDGRILDISTEKPRR